MNALKITHLILAVLSGLLVIAYGGVDDSPGAQGIGLLTIISSFFIIIFMFLPKNLR